MFEGEEIIKKLKEPFPLVDVEWRVQQSGAKDGKPWARVLCYVTNRAIMKRLDEVFGCMGWKNEYRPSPDGGVLCGISVWNEAQKEWITKWDGAENTQVDAVKGGLSGAMKRAAVQWGIGRYLYYLDSAFATCHLDNKGKHRAQALKNKNDRNSGTIYFTWDEPEMPKWSLPKPKEQA